MADNNIEFSGYPSFQDFVKNFLKTVVQCTKASNDMALSNDDHDFWTSFEQYKEFCASKGVDILNMIGEILHHQGLQCRWPQSTSRKYPHNDIEDRFESIVEANDMLLERIDSQLDEIINPNKKNKPIVSATTPVAISVVSTWNKQTGRKSEKADAWKKFNLLTARNIQRPQLKWKQKIDNSNTPFVPILKTKPNAIKDWRPAKRFQDESTRHEIKSVVDDFIHQQRLGDDVDIFEDRHPYVFELSVFEPKRWQLEKGTIQNYKATEETSLTIIDEPEQLNDLLQKLKIVKEFAVDLEHHSYRSFLGFTCLMQISTRQEDFLIDTLSLRDDLQILNEVFTDPNILKVFHGAEKDIDWLQRDFGLYVVNMFDTGQASRVLQLARHSLAFLLKEYCNIDASKQYQLADWRLRPIPDEMVKYARDDTHYLLYIYDKLRVTLIEKGDGQANLLKAVYDMSKTVCGRIYEKPIYTPDTYLGICNKFKKHLNDQQLECLKLLVKWRDTTAREEDESYGYVLPNHMMLRIAEQLPRESEGVLACCNPIPPLVKQNVAEICRLVKDSRTLRAKRLQNHNDSQPQAVPSSSIEKPSNQLPEWIQFDDGNSSSLTGFEIYPVAGPPLQTTPPKISIFQDAAIETEDTESAKKARLIMHSFRSPFELYLPKVNATSVNPQEINKKWKESVVKSNETKDSTAMKLDKSQNDTKPAPTSKRKVDETPKNGRQLTFRDELPKKMKKEQLGQNSGSESPVSFSYEKVATGSSFVPFDYSKAGKVKSVTGVQKPAKEDSALGKIREEPLKKGAIRNSKNLLRKNEKSMTFRR